MVKLWQCKSNSFLEKGWETRKGGEVKGTSGTLISHCTEEGEVKTVSIW